ncbi:MAG: DNA-directed RNA polymerase subunit beta [Candidatus Copromonas sp.]|jgi:DNA-directed RNA polymerase subunit beta|uniref:DNA-directed RNA polymerase subunit beta n=1 Tax=Pilosibacter fragilis TaxID=3078042 RepID=UPI000E4FFF85|nr:MULTISPECIES: DNA-directed RNA polymerase subunit beta [unclassified Clostridium]MDR3779984.1 DNA-directed RNA polymerase subunit beta [Candidatus Copromonas sp.]UYJ14880.1 MAG: DNA-directed RNA polymerase subunit beta [Lachnospiraceae bacterium]RHS23480.1 DNA-directed RNA polymerase subunit beta [Clostridium sp. AF12-28]RHS27198.1 DNA-directed RNA polymerase subunit beta [Clostridium sp. AF12-19]RHT41071.1 DNA-directed RNA polymerase subunit beta [Clostridium sp. AM30-24]
MEKSRMRPVPAGKSVRMSFSRQKEVLEMPNLIEIQKDSYQWFLDEGLKEVFDDISPIADFAGHLSLEFVDFTLCKDDIKYTIEECKERDATYAAPLKVKVRLCNKDKDEINEHEIFMGDLPLMTDTGSFVINGAERVIVSQLVRSPGIYYGIDHDKIGKELYSCTVIPNRGAWLEYETDSNDVFYVRVDRTRKVPVTVLIRALGYGTNAEIIDLFGEEPKLLASFGKDTSDNYQDGLLELYKKIRPGEPLSVDSAESLLNGMFFDPRRYDLAKVGRYKFNKKLHMKNRIVGQIPSEDIVDTSTGEILAEAGKAITKDQAIAIQNAAIPYVWIQTEERVEKVLSNLMVDLSAYVTFDPAEVGITELVYYPVLKEILEKAGDDEEALKAELHRNIHELVPKCITKEDILASINYNMHLEYGIGVKDDIDHLGNRRIRAVGELLQNQYRIGLSRMERVVRERMTTQDIDGITPQSLINIKPVTAAVKEFFGSSQLSQFMDQNNPLSELTHKRRLSALGPGGLSRERAGFEVRDVHYTHYGRMCPVETPEGPNIGLINSLASYAKVNQYGFVEAPYRVVDKTDPANPRVTDEVVYMTADEEDNYIVAQANEPLDEEGHFIHNNVSGRFREETSSFQKRQIDLMDVSPRMVFSVATSMIPFLQNDDANRALMGSNMQRQAVPLLSTEAPVVGTGIEGKAAVDSGVCVVAKNAGVVERSASNEIVIKRDSDGNRDVYRLIKFSRSNQSNSYNQKPIVYKGDHVEKGEVIADGPSTKDGEIALGKNPLIGFMTWEGYNYEDAVLLSEKLVMNDVYTSVHIEEYECESRDTKLGPEEITRDVPGVGEDALKDLDERGIIRIGAEVRAGDILVGKVTPKGETELTAEERLLRAIFGEKAREVRDTSLKVPHGAYGTIIDAKLFTRENGDELAPGVNETVRIYIAQKRKISVGDKMAGRHGNKGVVSRVLPVEDMPFLPNGRPLDIVLNPLGVPSRMNIGQVLEIHLSLAAKALGFNVSTPVFDGADENDIQDTLELANDYVNMEWDAFQEKYKDILRPDAMEYLGEHLDHRALWKGVPISRTGKVQLRDGRTGEYFDGPTTIGHMHYLKLHHLVDDKIHARSTGPYALVTQQPLGGKAQFGGQRFGEMEVWALEAYGAAYTLQEILTVKSDDVVGRVKTYEAIIKGENIPEPGIPESFKVLLKELQSLGLDVRVLRDNGEEVDMSENIDYSDTNYDLRSIIEGDRRYNDKEDLSDYGFQKQEFKGDELVNVEEDDYTNDGAKDDYVDDDYTEDDDK